MRTVAAIPPFKCKTPARQVCWIKVYRSSQNKLCDRDNSQKVGSSHLSRRSGPLLGANRDPRQRIGERPRQIDAMSHPVPTAAAQAEIGRASCRERVKMREGGGRLNK